MPDGRSELRRAADCGHPGHPDWDAFVAQHLDWVYGFIVHRVGRRPDAEDLTMEVFARAWRWVAPDRPAGQISAWLVRTARTVIADHWRQAARDRDMIAQVARLTPPRRTADATRAERQVAALLARLPSRYRTVLELRFLEGLSVAEAAKRMRIKPGNVRILQYRALRAAASLEPEGGGTDA